MEGLLALLGRGGGPAPDPAPPGILPSMGPEEMLANLAAQGIETQQVPAFLARDGDGYVTDSGASLIGAPDASGMAAMPINPDGTPAAPQFFNPGPPYTASDAPYIGPAPMSADDLDYSTGAMTPMNWEKYKGNTSSGGGFFTFADFYGRQGKDVPWPFQSESSLPSTNNYRLLPAEYRKPNYIMRNGRIIDMNYARSSPTPDASWRGGGGVGYPVAYAPGPTSWAIAGWPGSIGGFSWLSGGD